MGLFGRKKSPEEILAEGRAQFIQGLSLIHISYPTRLQLISFAVFCI